MDNERADNMKNEHGQIVLILILVMVVALAIGISVIGRSLSDISTSSKVEKSSRAFSAAEAGIERAIQIDSAIFSSIDLGNESSIMGVKKSNVPDPAVPGQAFEYPAFTKEEFAHVWLADPTTLEPVYKASDLEVYWGNAGVTGADEPAIEISVVYQDPANVYKSKKYFYDRNAAIRNNGFDYTSPICPSPSITTSLSPTASKSFFCKATLDVSGLNKLILLRARLLYNSTAQAFAVKPTAGSLPVQARIFTATGLAGDTQRTVQVFRQDKVVPPYFDYGIFSVGDINK